MAGLEGLHVALGFLGEEARRGDARLASLADADLERPVIAYDGRMLTLDQFIRGSCSATSRGT